ncbi:unnamed protein product, partial [Ascophyllum nodosum]
MGRHEQLPSWAATSDSAPSLPRASRRRRKRPHGELHRAITQREEASSAAAPEEKALAGEPAPEAPRFPSSSPEAFLLKYFHHAAPAQLLRYFLYPLERPTIPVTDLPTLPHPQIPSLIACTQQRVAVPLISSSPREPRGSKMVGQRWSIAPTQGV